MTDDRITIIAQPEFDLEVLSGCGSWLVHRVTGAIQATLVDADDPDNEWAFSIARFDVDEYRRWCEAAGVAMAQQVDILCIGYWTRGGHYEDPETDYRNEVLRGLGGHRS